MPTAMHNRQVVALRVKRHKEAAKSRRDQETVELQHLADLLPFPGDVSANLDKGTVLRLAISYLKMKQYTKHGGQSLLNSWDFGQINNGNDGSTSWDLQEEEEAVPESDMMLGILDGFLMFVDGRGKILYVSEQVDDHLHMPETDMIGRSMVDFLHPDDQREFARQYLPHNPTDCSCQGPKGRLALPCPPSKDSRDIKLPSGEELSVSQTDAEHLIRERLFYVRMRCNVVKNGTKTKQSGFSLVQWSGRLRLQEKSNGSRGKMAVMGLVAICRVMQTSPLIDIRLDGNMFMSRHNMDMRFIFCDPRIVTLIGYEPTEVIGKTAYQFHNPLDAQKIHSCHSNLIVKGSSVSKYYRFLGKTGCWVWMQTRATIIYSANQSPQYVVCMNYIIGEDEGKRYLQMELEEQGIPANSSQPEPAGFTEETCSPLPNETDHSRYCAPYMPSPESSNTDRGSPNTDSGCEMSPFEDDLPNRASENTSTNGAFSFSQFTDLNEVCSKGVELAMEHGVGDQPASSIPAPSFGEGELYDLLETTLNQQAMLPPESQSQAMVVDITDDQPECPDSAVPQPIHDVLVADVEMMDATDNGASVEEVYQGSDPQEILTSNADGTCVRHEPSISMAERQRKSEIGNGILRALLNEEKDDILLSQVAFKKATKEKEEELTSNGHQLNLNVRVTSPNSVISPNGMLNGNQLCSTMVDEHAAKLMLRLGAKPEDFPASVATMITQNSTSSGQAPDNRQKSLLHQLVSSPREQRNTILQLTKATSGATNTVTQQPSGQMPHMSNTRTQNGKHVNNAQTYCVNSENAEPRQPGSCLEHLLMSDMNFSPNQGSDVIMEMEKTREKIAHINLQADSPLLKQLLVGTIDRSKLASGAHSQEVLRPQSRSTLHQHNAAGHAQAVRPPRPQQQLSQAAATSPSIVSSLLSKYTTAPSVRSAPVQPVTTEAAMSSFLQQTMEPRQHEQALEDALASLPEFSSGLPDLASGLPDLASQDDMGDLFSNFTQDTESLMLEDVESLLAGSDVEVDALLAEEARQTELWYSQLHQDIGLP